VRRSATSSSVSATRAYGLVTVTGVDVTADLRQATVYYSALGRADKRGTGSCRRSGRSKQVSTQARSKRRLRICAPRWAARCA